jgi:phage terminase small subunit
MPSNGLTPKQEAFCLAYVLSGNATEAYKQAGYSDGMATKTASEAASRLLKNSKVVARLAELRAPAAEAAVMTIAGHLDDLKDLRDMAKQEGKYSAAVAAEVARGKVSGFYVEKVEHSGNVTVTAGPLDQAL